jgi:DNA-binding HxlR family transcriptional regulator
LRIVSFAGALEAWMEKVATKLSRSMGLPACPVETTLLLIGSKWKVLILRDLAGGRRRFGELRRSLGGISQKVLTSNLREMEADGLLTRTAYPEVPPRVEYELTPLGASLAPVLDALRDWGEGYQAANPERPLVATASHYA